ncbi:MAG: Holliday junction resolvase RuvX [Caldilineaceae bacterium SB0664_bin_27]|uniref:Putative pre-16S rRNA nuclease n=1 Tax=Caldilineaceae bacterium SB0664_bin_27 TaxID=2605260 RepID=A0A6B0YR20_9CHLR|nr:Holliday junction resolvase RuvX [Caldilineaceae bacterium SB0664_bin_27]
MTQPNLSKPSLPPGKIIALDVGEARIGLATCDPLRLTVRPLRTLLRRNRRRDFDSLAQIYTEEEAVLIVCGLPFNMDGSEGPQARRIRNWAARFTRALGNILGNEVPLVFWDERLSSFSADEWIAAEGPHTAGQDAVAAAVILRSYLDNQRG